MSDPVDPEISIGKLWESLDEVRANTLRIGKVTTEIYEKQLAGEIHDLAEVMSDIVYLVREHLSCHDCRVVDHTHDTELHAGVELVYEGVVSRTDA